ncbi:MAG: hypothetical protein JXM70_18700 [Pirellulales bacterium]|nr:hypothetical protein [Pirellulales bacterium]
MQSTTTVVCRALVMVVCLITIPLAALFGTSLPDLVKTLGWGEQSVSVREQGGMAPAYSPSIPGVAGVPGDSAAPGVNVAEGLPAEHLPQMAGATGMREDTRTVPASYSEPVSISVSSENHRNSTQPALVPETSQGTAARFEQIQRRIGSMGGAFRLESFGTSRQFYRFQCDMPLAAGSAGRDAPVAVRHFEATSENSLQAMETVLAEIEAWLSNR